MAVVENRFVCDLSKPVQAQALKGNVFSLDNFGSRISVLIYNNGQPATISGSITANCILPDGSTVNVNGTLTTENGGSKAYIDVPQGCLLIPGILKIAIKCTSSSVITTLAAIVANVYMTKTDNVITPSQQIINDWNAEVSAAIATQNAAIANQDTKINDLKSAFDADVISNGFYPFGFENGRLNTTTGANRTGDSYAGSYLRTIDYVPVLESLAISFHADIEVTCCVYDSTKTYLGVAINNKRYIPTGGMPCIINYSNLTGTYSTAKYCRFYFGLYVGGSLDPANGYSYVSPVWNKNDGTFNEIKAKTENIDLIHNQPTIEAVHNLEYPDFYDRTAQFGGYIAGLIDGDDGSIRSSSNRYSTAGYVPVDTTKHYQLQAVGYGIIKPQIIAYYNQNKAFISKETGVNISAATFPSGTKYIRYSITSTQYNDYVVSNNVLKFVSIPTASTPVYSDSIVTKIPLKKVTIPYIDTELAELINSTKGWININGSGTVKTIVEHEEQKAGYITVKFSNMLRVNFPDSASNGTALAWNDISENILSNITINGNAADILVPTYRSLVLNVTDKKLHLRNRTQMLASDFVLLANNAYEPQGWVINLENYQLRLTSDDVVLKQGVGRYNVRGNGFNDAVYDFSASLLDVSDCEAFVFATDPHIFGIGDVMDEEDVQKLIFGFFNYIESCYKSSPASFVLYGGDWLNNSDTPAVAASKLGMIRGAIRNTEQTYLLVGNHDTNYQGTEVSGKTRLSTQDMKNLWYDGKNTYYKFKGRNTTFYCFDSGVENQTLDAQSNLGKEQVAWFASSLKTDTSEHMAIAIHILYPYSSDRSALQPLTDEILAIAETYNSGGSITFDDVTYNYAEQNPNHDKRISLLIAGHSHEDYNMLSHGILCIVTKNAWIPSNSTMAFDFVTVDYDNSIVKTFRVGTGDNRVISMITGENIS